MLGQPLIIPPDYLTNLILGLTDRQVKIASMISAAAYLFVPAHEFGHIVLNASGRRFIESECGQLTAEMLVTGRAPCIRPKDVGAYHGKLPTPSDQLQSMDTRRRQQLIQAWREEFAADLLGLKLCIITETEDAMLDFRSKIKMSDRKKLAPVIAMGGVELVLIILGLVERYSLHRRGPRLLDDHPSAYARLANIRTAIALWERSPDVSPVDNTDHLLEFGEAFERMSDRILHVILDGNA
jgi:hypothetical protein